MYIHFDTLYVFAIGLFLCFVVFLSSCGLEVLRWHLKWDTFLFCYIICGIASMSS
jgi:hypothetical protein